jgi:diacylglycerol kinase family enzyme
MNPNASQVRDKRTRQELEGQLRSVLLRRDGEAPTIIETEAQDETRPAVESALADGVRAVVGVGGDGTHREIAASLADTGVPLGIVPGGTGNQLAGILGVPSSAGKAVAVLEGAKPRRIDLGSVSLSLVAEPHGPMPAEDRVGARSTEAIFAIGCGAGFDARIMATTPHHLKRRFGRTAYFAQAIKLAVAIGVVPYRLTVDGEPIETEASIALVANMGQLIPGLVGPRLPIIPDDGLLDLIVVGARGPLHGMKGLMDQLLRTSLGGGTGSDSLRLRGRSITVEADRPEPLEVDGDHVGWGSLEARVLPGALDVLVPPEAYVD